MKNKILKRMICLLLVVPFVMLSACKKSGGAAPSGEDEEQPAAVSEDYVGPGIHEAEVTATSAKFIAAGKTDYTLVIPDEYVNYEYMAATMLADWLNRSTGCTLAIKFESEVDPADEKIVAIGDTERLKKSGISVSTDYLGANGFIVKTVGDTIYISGARTIIKLGTLYGAQEFLKYAIDWHPYTADEVYYEEKAAIPFYEMDIVEVPDFQNRGIGYYELTSNETYLHYMRQNINYERKVPWGAHSHFQVLPPAKYAQEHPDWYYYSVTDGDGSAYTPEIDGNFNVYAQLNISNEEMKQEYIKELTRILLEEYPDTEYVNMGPQDSDTCCNCDECKAKMAEYNTNYAGIAMMFTNDVARAVRDNVHAVDPTRDIYVYYIAYFKLLPPPVHLDESGNYVADCPEVVPDPDCVRVDFCPHGYNASELFDSRQNDTYYNYLLGWDAIADNMRAHIYSMNFTCTIYTHKDNDTMAANWRIFAEHGCNEAYTQGWLNAYAAQWTPMKLYVQSKLMWDLSQNFDELAYDFIDHYYGEYAADIREMYDLMTTYTEYAHSAKGMTGNVYLQLQREMYWPFGYIEAGRKIMERVLGKLEAIKESDPEKYDRYYIRVSRVFIENAYVRFELYKSRYTAEEAVPVIDWLESVVNRLGIVKVVESSGPNSNLSDRIQQWREFYNVA